MRRISAALWARNHRRKAATHCPPPPPPAAARQPSRPTPSSHPCRYAREGLRRSVDAVLVVHEHGHPHVLVLQVC